MKANPPLKLSTFRQAISCDLDRVILPGEVPIVMREAAYRYRMAWLMKGCPRGGKGETWRELAELLDRAAVEAEALVTEAYKPTVR